MTFLSVLRAHAGTFVPMLDFIESPNALLPDTDFSGSVAAPLCENANDEFGMSLPVKNIS